MYKNFNFSLLLSPLFSLVILLASQNTWATVPIWRTYKSEGGYFSVELPCTAKSIVDKVDDNLKRVIYGCPFDGAIYNITETTFSKATGFKYKETHPSTLIEDTSTDLIKQVRVEKGRAEVNKIFQQGVYKALQFETSSHKSHTYTHVYDGPEEIFVIKISGPDTEMLVFKRVLSSLKILK